jgi:aspartate/methionine/tyrosine aminotransferase
MRRQVPFDKRIVDETIEQLGVAPVRCSIREQKRLVDQLEKKLGVQYIRMEFGIPGLKTDKTAIGAEIEALSGGEITSQYPPFDGLPALKKATAVFIKKFF